MAVTYKDIDLLTQKSTVAGTEKLPVSDTQYVTPAQIAALASGDVPMTENSSSTTVSQSLQPKHFYRWTAAITSITVTLAAGQSGVLNEYQFEFKAGNGCSLSLPSGVIWADNTAPSFTTGHIYQVSIVNNCAMYAEFY